MNRAVDIAATWHVSGRSFAPLVTTLDPGAEKGDNLDTNRAESGMIGGVIRPTRYPCGGVDGIRCSNPSPNETGRYVGAYALICPGRKLTTAGQKKT